MFLYGMLKDPQPDLTRVYAAILESLMGNVILAAGDTVLVEGQLKAPLLEAGMSWEKVMLQLAMLLYFAVVYGLFLDMDQLNKIHKTFMDKYKNLYLLSNIIRGHLATVGTRTRGELRDQIIGNGMVYIENHKDFIAFLNRISTLLSLRMKQRKVDLNAAKTLLFSAWPNAPITSSNNNNNNNNAPVALDFGQETQINDRLSEAFFGQLMLGTPGMQNNNNNNNNAVPPLVVDDMPSLAEEHAPSFQEMLWNSVHNASVQQLANYNQHLLAGPQAMQMEWWNAAAGLLNQQNVADFGDTDIKGID